MSTKKTKKKRTPKQIAATKRMLAARAASLGKPAKKAKAKKAKKKTKAKQTPKAKPHSVKASKPKEAKKTKAKTAKKISKKVSKKAKKASKKSGTKRRRTGRVAINPTGRDAGVGICVRIRNGETVRDIDTPGRINYQAGKAIFMPTADRRQTVPFDTPGQVTGDRLGEVLSISYQWSGVKYTHQFNGRLPVLLKLPGGVHCATGLRWSRGQGFKDAT